MKAIITIFLSCVFVATLNAQHGYVGAGGAMGGVEALRRLKMEDMQMRMAEQDMELQRRGYVEPFGPFTPYDLLLYGGRDGRTFLGCLTCVSPQREAIANPLSRFGNPLSSLSIMNPLGLGNPLLPYSPCNPLATRPPVVVDPAGNFYGVFTVSSVTSRQRLQRPTLNAWLHDLCAK